MSRSPRRPPAAGSCSSRAAGLLLAVVLVAGSGVAAANGETRLLNLLIDAEGLPALHTEPEEGTPVMWLPQFRLFDAAGRPLWAFTLMPSSRKEFRRELARRVAAREPLPEGRTLHQEARYFLRRGGLPLNLTTLPASELTVVEYWTDGCGQCDTLRREVDRFLDRAGDLSIQRLRVFIDLDEFQ